MPVAFIPLSAGITLKGLNQKILAFYGHPAADRASSTRLGTLAVDCVASCETQLVVIADLHFVDFRHRNGQEVSNHLKGLANEMPVTFVYVGVRLLRVLKPMPARHETAGTNPAGDTPLGKALPDISQPGPGS